MRSRVIRICVISIGCLVVVTASACVYRAWQQHVNARALAITALDGIQEARFVRVVNRQC